MEEEPSEDPNTISIGTERTRARVYVFGEISDTADAPVSKEVVSMYCGGRYAGKRTTDTDGYFEFSFKRPSKPIRCYAEDTSGGRSRRITVR